MTQLTPAILMPMFSMLFNGQPHTSSKSMVPYQCQPTKPIYTDYIEHANPNNLTAFIYDESASEPGFDQTLACHLTQVSPFRAAAVLDLLADEPKRLATIRGVLKNHTSQEHYNFIIGASQMTLLNKKDGVSQNFKTQNTP